ncbi:MAG: hypothetical protein PHP00_00550 [Thiotrichaceae bacterium]|nr:hypothetical protein [Thiotrichaceae bacterium]
MKNILLTGVPRSGTTLTCYLLNQCANTVALIEPMAVGILPTLPNNDAIRQEIQNFCQQTRYSLLNSRIAISSHIDGKLVDNQYETEQTGHLRKHLAMIGEVTIDKTLTEEFTLCIKHPAAFTALLPVLHPYFSCYALIRNPLAILASWNSVQMPMEQGHAPMAEQLDSTLADTLSACPDKWERQLRLLHWFFQQYAQFLPSERIIRYEDIITSEGLCLNSIVPTIGRNITVLRSKNTQYDVDLMQQLAEKLLSSTGSYWDFYQKTDIEKLVCSTF